MVVQQFIIICHSLQVLQVYFLLLNFLYLFRKSLNIIISFYLKHTNHLPVKPGAAIMLASHYPEVDTRWSYECGILNFARNLISVFNFDISQATAEVITMPTEGHTIALEHNTEVPRRYYEGNKM